MADDNGTGNGRIYVKFGTGDTDEMPIEWAEKMLIAWRNSNPNQFGKALVEAAVKGR